MGLIARAFRFIGRNSDPALRTEAVGSITSNDYVPSNGGLFRGLNASVAGLITVKRPDNTSVQVYVNTGWNPQGGMKIVNRTTASTDTATIIAAELEA